MSAIASFTFNPFQENTYILYDDSGECAIVDPGCYEISEKEQLRSFIEDQQLRPVLLLNTHCHIDHVLGNKFVHDTWGLLPRMHRGELEVLNSIPAYSDTLGIRYEQSPAPEVYLEEGGLVSYGHSEWQVIFTPGHSPAGICFYNKEDKILIAGDTLFQGSIGRTDLPGGDTETLMKSITEKLLTLPEEVTVYAGHMGKTDIGTEKRTNPFVLAYQRGQLW